ncbi:hypothetical protein N473_18485 [Pseudoalteromonas luteoviolacea CPMOR-1]|uniref:Uncharacterized protein n=1 Tax=Pseudoalteromonas luteoviolacea CPMOR-1 TaxID=1365248 RepID=A0A167KD69_9GAMM|nr:hypothetical protein [Pseudoalteromonas luteoviolacea]KZN62618.1 hypothetical protein N473_18485 [Pseudoalteromonas luteoviolacea CPMOR-1]
MNSVFINPLEWRTPGPKAVVGLVTYVVEGGATVTQPLTLNELKLICASREEEYQAEQLEKERLKRECSVYGCDSIEKQFSFKEFEKILLLSLASHLKNHDEDLEKLATELVAPIQIPTKSGVLETIDGWLCWADKIKDPQQRIAVMKSIASAKDYILRAERLMQGARITVS